MDRSAITPHPIRQANVNTSSKALTEFAKLTERSLDLGDDHHSGIAGGRARNGLPATRLNEDRRRI
jgi:hypothetical protein